MTLIAYASLVRSAANTSFLVRLVALVALVAPTSACGESPSPKAPLKEESIHPLSETALHDDKPSGARRPVPVEVIREPEPASGPTELKTEPKSAPSSVPASAPGKSGKSGTQAVLPRAECDRVMDKYLELEVKKNPQFKSLPPEIVKMVIDQAKEQARAEHGEPPCTGTHAQYMCAMAATSTAAWKNCMQ